MTRDYVAFGLRVRSAIAFPGAMPAATIAAGDHAPDIEIAFGRGEIGPETAAEGPYRVGPHGFEFALPGVAHYACIGDRVLIDGDADASEDDIAAMLVATMLPAILWSRGEIVLHAAAFARPAATHAVAVAGPSGAGKSTLLARMAAAGARIVADDSTCLRRTSDRAVSASGLPGGWYDPLGDAPPRRFNAVSVAAQLAACPLGRILVLTPGLAAPVALHGSDALKALLDNRHRPRIARLMRREAALLPEMAAICESVPVVAVPSRVGDIVSSWPDIFDIGAK